MKDNSTQLYKVIQTVVVLTIGLIVIGGTFFMRDDPYVQNQALASQTKRVFYTIAFAADSAFQTANSIDFDRKVSKMTYTSTSSVPVLVYHGVIAHPDGSLINLTEQQFEDQMFALKKAGYHTISFDQLYAFGTQGGDLPKNPVVITFDDGRADSFYNADPILAALGYRANMFVITSFAKGAKAGGYYLTPDELVMMKNTGRWEIGSHSENGHVPYQINKDGAQGHFFSNPLWLPEKDRVETNAEFMLRITDDYQISRTYLEDLLHTDVSAFAFPFGDLGQAQESDQTRTKEVIAAASTEYNMLFYQFRPGEYFSQFTKPDAKTKTLLVHRIDANNTMSGPDLVAELQKSSQKNLPYADSFTSDNGWLSVWGTHTIKDGVLSMSASKDQSGAGTIIDGSQIWTDYTVQSTLISPSRTGFFLWMRFADDENNAGCNFGTDFVHIEQTVNGRKNVLKGVLLADAIPQGAFTVSASVHGRTISCSINGKTIVSSDFLDESLSQGGTGIKIWDQTLGKSSINITRFSAEPIKAAQ